MLPNSDDVWVSGLVDRLGHGNDIISAANGKLCHTIPWRLAHALSDY